jgi:HSP20 family protein
MTQLSRITDELMPLQGIFSDMLDVDRFFGRDPFLRGLKKMPAANIKEKNNHYEVELAAPGMKKEDFQVNMDNNILTISAHHKEEKKEDKENYTRREFNYSSFSRSFEVPAAVNTDQVAAQYKDGILVLTLPKKQEAPVSNKKEIKVS